MLAETRFAVYGRAQPAGRESQGGLQTHKMHMLLLHTHRYTALMEQCWQDEPQQRPDFVFVTGELRGLLPAEQVWE